MTSAATAEPKILVIDDDKEIRYSLERVLSSRKYQVLTAGSGEEGLEVVKEAKPQVVFMDIRMGGMSGLETLQHLRSIEPKPMVILMTAFGTTQTAIEAMKFGAFDYIMKPFDIKKVIALTEGALNAYRDLVSLRDKEDRPILNTDDYKEGMVGKSEAMQEVFKVIGQVAFSDVTVLITGESGTGKELVARGIYQHSRRTQKPFVAVNCAAIPENLIESELFGHEKGSFTGATGQRIGKFEVCDGGTIFLDEIGDMALPTQTKILRVIQDGEYQRVGGMKTLKTNVRIIAATNRNLEEMVAEKTFREDLYYRLNVVRLRLPALRERKEDIPDLIDFALQKLVKKQQTHVNKVSPEAMTLLKHYNWPGNVRELENVIYRSAVLAQGEAILIKDLPEEIRHGQLSESSKGLGPEDADEGRSETPLESLGDEDFSPHAISRASREEAPSLLESLSVGDLWDQLYEKTRAEASGNLLSVVEKELIRRVLRETGGNQVKASKLLGITRATLRKRIDQYDL
ncbi:MAG: sigma-54 dependent transcriptional regulator [Opitutales bacterium]|nr:sigma-54 dependent transcriptional regulator [Opitutales bacterium]